MVITGISSEKSKNLSHKHRHACWPLARARGARFTLPWNKASKRYNQLRVQVDEIFSDDVIGAIPLNSNSESDPRIKFFPADSVRLRSEINAYETLKSLQGSVVPRCLGVFEINGFSGSSVSVPSTGWLSDSTLQLKAQASNCSAQYGCSCASCNLCVPSSHEYSVW